MECCKCISMKKAGRRSSMKSHFYGFGGLGAYTNNLKSILYVQMHCLPISEKMLRELSLLAKYAKEFLRMMNLQQKNEVETNGKQKL